MFIGGLLIKRFDGFRRLVRRAAEEYNHPLAVPEEDMILANRTLAAMGGPPAASQVQGRFTGDTLGVMLLFLLTQEMTCRVGLLGKTEETMGRLKGLVHLFGHAVWPMVTGKPPLGFQEVVRELSPNSAALRPLVRYDDRDGEPTGIEPAGGAGIVRTGPDHGPYTLAVLLGDGTGPAPLGAGEGALHPAVLILPSNS